MPKNRDKFKKAAAEANKEKSIGFKTFDYKDPTPKEAVARIMLREHNTSLKFRR